jgi:hypothetical protein
MGHPGMGKSTAMEELNLRSSFIAQMRAELEGYLTSQFPGHTIMTNLAASWTLMINRVNKRNKAIKCVVLSADHHGFTCKTIRHVREPQLSPPFVPYEDPQAVEKAIEMVARVLRK